ncbi:MAG: YfhO family protein [Acidobacteriaceae bacterium]|nr:YfhO family protein [Acidobacteriaceae bacterium]MBV9294624.1 YfhO family protein [Acidobacteriaceae bacterium]MBV9767695.1 YfhO family protein [Acidobacteriaceae bacterium]
MDNARRFISFKSFWAHDNYRAALVLIAILHVCFFQCIWGHRTFLESTQEAPSILPNGAWAGKKTDHANFNKVADPGAAAWQSEPWLALVRNQYVHEKHLPLWNPYQGYGQPLAANMQSQPFYPLTWALLIHLTPHTYNWYILLRLFVAGFCAYLYLRLFLSFLPALAAGITTMLAGYFMLYLTMPHLSVEILLPASLLTAEYLLRKQSYKALIWFAIVLLLVFLGGMPESALFVLIFQYSYLLFRIICDAHLRLERVRCAKYVVLSSLAGVSGAAFLLLPFWSYLQQSFTGHDASSLEAMPGLLRDTRRISALTYLFPLLFGPVNSTTLAPDASPLRNYMGLIMFYLGLLAVAALWRERDDEKLLRSLTWFFSIPICLLLLKRYGIGVINDLGRLPLLRLVIFLKYEEIVISVCAAVLSAIGLERLIRRHISTRTQAVVLALTVLLSFGGLFRSRAILIKEVSVDHILPQFPVIAMGIPICLLFFLALSLIVFNRPGRPPSEGPVIGSNMGIFVLALLSAELCLNYIIPVYYMLNRPPRDSSDPYVGAPFISFLESHLPKHDRVFARNMVLTPNWAAAFGLFDVRDLDAMYTKKYFPFLETFFPTWQSLWPTDFVSCFTGWGPYNFSNALERRFLQLSSVKYIATEQPYGIPNTMIEEILKQNPGPLPPGIGRSDFTIADITRETLGEHPPYQRLPYYLTVPESTGIFHFSYGLNSSAFNKGGDGVGFALELRDPAGSITKLFYNYIDPKHNLNERKWMDSSLDLSRYRGQPIQLLFSTDGGPKGDTSYDWAGWSDFHFDDQQNELDGGFRKAFDGEAKVYQYDHVLPRASIYFHADILKTDNEVLKRLADPSLDVFNTVVLDASQLDQKQALAVNEVNRNTPQPLDAATITSYTSQVVDIDASLHQNGILMLNDSGDTDWNVEVDGQRDRWFAADYLFRGVLLKPGKHRVRFVYQPRSFYIGTAISLSSFFTVLAFGLLRKGVNAYH